MTGYKPSDEVLAYYTKVKQLPDGRWAGVQQLLFHWTLHVDISEMGYDDRWCIETRAQAEEALDAFDGTGEPLHWHRHPPSGVRRDPLTDERWGDGEIQPSKRDAALRRV